MNKSNFWIWLLVVIVGLGFGFWVLGFWLGGCGTASRPEQATTTTSVSGGTTTTSGQGGISGKVTWSWSGYSAANQTGTLMVFLWTDEDFENGDLIATQGLSPAYQKFNLSKGQTSASYNFSSPGGPLKGSATSTSSTYYLFAILYVGRSVSMVGGAFPDAQTGDKIGQFSDGKLPISFGGSTHAQAITYNGTSQPNKNFALNGTWTTSTTTTTMPPSAFWQNIGNVTRNGSAEGARVDALVCDNSGNLYVGGYFDSIGGKPANNIAKWNHSTSSWESLLGGLGSEVNALALGPSGNLYAAEINKVKKWNGTSWSSLGSGFTGTMVVLLALAVDQSGNVYAGGSFDYADGVPANNVAKWKTTLSTWDAMAGGLRQTGWSNPTGQVFDMTAGSDGNIYLAGSFNTTESISIIGIAKWKVASSSWEALPAGGGGLAVAADSYGNIYTQPGRWSGSTWEAFTDSVASRPPTSVIAARSPSEVFMGSDGYGAPVETAGAVAKLSGTTWNNLAGDLIKSAGYADVRALAIDPSGDLYVGGKFTSAGGTAAANIVKRLSP